MQGELEKYYGYPQFDLLLDNESSAEHAKLKQIIMNSYDSIFVIDNQAKVLFASHSTCRFMGLEPEDLIGRQVNDLVKEGVYNRSIALEALQKRKVVTGLVKTRIGLNLFSTATPLFNDAGEITMVITNTRDKTLVDKYLEALDQANSKAKRFKNAVEYLSEHYVEQKPIVAVSPQMRKVMANTEIVARCDSPVLLFGETGTGKEVLARYIHHHSSRAKEPFIPVNCAAIPHELLESEFFGYVAGAFTGASSQGKAGLLEIADKGTLFLDELGELPLAMQSKLLRVLETGEFQKLGSTGIRRTDLRIISATNRNLKAMMSQNQFRSDLYYRLNVIPIELPPLKERPQDICTLSNNFLEELNRKYGLKKVFSEQAKQAFLTYSWPGNVRELRNVIERLVVTTPGDVLHFEEEGSSQNVVHLSMVETKKSPSSGYRGTLKDVLKAVEEEYISRVLAECGGKVGEAAEKLGIHRTMLYRKSRYKD
ncbi:MAG TPA: sigma 54-interacting transcriptional regulator [Bacillota bacterium]|nr:sigma 54-interacting transcriptional regulator [Bacillota bacterium]